MAEIKFVLYVGRDKNGSYARLKPKATFVSDMINMSPKKMKNFFVAWPDQKGSFRKSLLAQIEEHGLPEAKALELLASINFS